MWRMNATFRNTLKRQEQHSLTRKHHFLRKLQYAIAAEIILSQTVLADVLANDYDNRSRD